MNKISLWTHHALKISIKGAEDVVVSSGAADLLINHCQMIDLYPLPEGDSQIDDFFEMDFALGESCGHMYPSRSASVFFILLFHPSLRLFATPRSWVLAVWRGDAPSADIICIENDEDLP